MRALVAANRLAPLALVAAAQLVAATAWADATEDAALLHLDRGVAAFRAGDFARAHRELEAAHDLAPDRANPYRWLALTEVQLGDCQRALVNIAAFLARVPPDEPRVAELVRLRELCQRTGVLRVDSTPPRAHLRLDGADVGVTPFRSLSLRAGDHTLVADAPGHAATSRAIVLPAGGALDVHLHLTPSRRSLTARWWFWPAVIGTAALAGTAIVLVTHDAPATLPPVTCDPAGCMAGGG